MRWVAWTTRWPLIEIQLTFLQLPFVAFFRCCVLTNHLFWQLLSLMNERWLSQSGFTRLVAGSRSVSLYSICLARGWYQPHTGCFQPLSGLLGWLLSARADLWPPTFPSINSYPLTLKQWKVFFQGWAKRGGFNNGLCAQTSCIILKTVCPW